MEGMKKQHITLSEKDRQQLEKMMSGGKLKASVNKRVIGLLELDRGKSYTAVAETVGVTIQTVSKWAKKYEESGLALLEDEPRSGRPKSFTSWDRAKITALACSDAPEGYGKWSLRLLADKAVELEYCSGISHTEVGRILKKTTSSRI